MLADHLVEWSRLGIRWLHVVAGVVWIGTSFYFVWLNNHVRAEPDMPEGSAAELWAVHGGGFYRVLKYETLDVLPETLHWFKWEAYTTWLSGLSLLILIYYVDAPVFLIDPSRADLTSFEAILIGVSSLAIGWVVYHALCRSPLLATPIAFSVVAMVLLVTAAIVLNQLFSGRGAYIHVGAILGTLMAGNVFFVIIPAQRHMVKALSEGRNPDLFKGHHAAQRSLHNNYMTLPVIFIMISSHFPFTYGGTAGWAILGGLILIGVSIRHWFNLRGQGQLNAWILPAATIAMVGLALATAPAEPLTPTDPPTLEEGYAVIEARCVACHSEIPTQPGFDAPPLGLAFDTVDQVLAASTRIRAMAVDSEAMPLGNITQMTAAERALLGAWLDEHS